MSEQAEKKFVRLQPPAGDAINVIYKESYGKLQFSQFLLAVAENYRNKGQPNIADSILSLAKIKAMNGTNSVLPSTNMSQFSFDLISKGGERENVATVRFYEDQVGGAS